MFQADLRFTQYVQKVISRNLFRIHHSFYTLVPSCGSSLELLTAHPRFEMLKCLLPTGLSLSPSGSRGQEIPHRAEGDHGAGRPLSAVRKRKGPDLETAPRLLRDLPTVAAQAAALRQVEQTRGHGPGLMSLESQLLGFHIEFARAILILHVTEGFFVPFLSFGHVIVNKLAACVI